MEQKKSLLLKNTNFNTNFFHRTDFIERKEEGK